MMSRDYTKRKYLHDRCMGFLCSIFDDDRAMWRADCLRKVAAFLESEGFDSDSAEWRAESWADLSLTDYSEEAELITLHDAIRELSEACGPDYGDF